MKNTLIILFVFVAHFSFAQKLAGMYNSKQNFGIYAYNLATGKCEIGKPIPDSLGLPNQFLSGICHLNSKVYGVVGNFEKQQTTIYQYDFDSKEYSVIYTSSKSFSEKLLASRNGLLYGSGYDSIKGFYLFELNPVTKEYKEYYTNDGLVCKYGHYFLIAENNKMYYQYYTEKPDMGHLMEFDLQTKKISEKIATHDLPYPFMYMRQYCMADIGDGKIACVSIASDVFVYDYINNVHRIYKNINLKKQFSGPVGNIIQKDGLLYTIVHSKKYASLLCIDLKTGMYSEVVEFSQIKSVWGEACFASNGVIYAFDFGYSGGIYGYDFTTKKTVVLKKFTDNAFKVESECIYVK